MKFKILPLILAAACAVLPAAACSRGAEEENFFTESGAAYCEAEEELLVGAADAEGNSAETQAELSAENSDEAETLTEAEDFTEAEDPAESPIEDSTDLNNKSEPIKEEQTQQLTEEQAETETAQDEAEPVKAEETAQDEKAEQEAEQAEEEREETETVFTETEKENAEYIECICTNLNIRSGAGTGYTSLGKAEKGTLFAYLGGENGWYKTYYKGKVAYLSANTSYTRIVEMERGSDDAENVISEGVKLIGTKYVYGAVRLHDGTGKLLSGFTAEEFDCSSLIQYIFYYGAGAILQVNTRTQFYQGEYVAPSALQRGDCIYFTNSSRCNNTGIERVGHVALYLGDGYILHTASDYCKIEKMSETRRNYYIEARRFI